MEMKALLQPPHVGFLRELRDEDHVPAFACGTFAQSADE